MLGHEGDIWFVGWMGWNNGGLDCWTEDKATRQTDVLYPDKDKTSLDLGLIRIPYHLCLCLSLFAVLHTPFLYTCHLPALYLLTCLPFTLLPYASVLETDGPIPSFSFFLFLFLSFPFLSFLFLFGQTLILTLSIMSHIFALVAICLHFCSFACLCIVVTKQTDKDKNMA